MWKARSQSTLGDRNVNENNGRCPFTKNFWNFPLEISVRGNGSISNRAVSKLVYNAGVLLGRVLNNKLSSSRI